jgi:hypothetical protein
VTQVQVWDGSDDGPYAAAARAQDLREQTYRLVRELVQSLRDSARFLPTPGMVTTRLVFADDLIKHLTGQAPDWYENPNRAYRDLQEICSLYHAMAGHSGMVDHIEHVLARIREFRTYAHAA